MIKRVLLSLLLLSSAPAQALTVYKWTDEQGRTHFSDEPPATGAPVDRLHMQPSKPSTSASKQKAGSAAAGEDFQRMEKQAVNGQTKAETAYRGRRCAEAKHARVQLEGVGDADPDDKQWQAALKKADQEINKWCG